MMSEDLMCRIVEVYKLLQSRNLTLTMTKSVAISLADVFDEGGGAALKTALSKIYMGVLNEKSPNVMLSLSLRFYRENTFFYYVVIAKQAQTGVSIEMLIKDEQKREL